LEDTWIQRAHKLTTGGSRLGARAEVLEIQAIRKAKSLLNRKQSKGGYWA
jgi:hypothetical protein